MIYRLLMAALCVVFFTGTVEARQRHRTQGVILAHPDCNGTGPNAMPCEGVSPSPRGERIARSGFGTAQKIYTPKIRKVATKTVQNIPRNIPKRAFTRVSDAVPAQVIGGRPPGCPHAFCGCGASLHLFGRIIPSLNLAANWLRFPRAMAAPKMAAARPGHVFVLEQHISGSIWLVHDSNSGRHLTRLHARSIAGYTIVNPHGSSYPHGSS